MCKNPLRLLPLQQVWPEVTPIISFRWKEKMMYIISLRLWMRTGLFDVIKSPEIPKVILLCQGVPVIGTQLDWDSGSITY
jgi:hypothetical protein